MIVNQPVTGDTDYGYRVFMFLDAKLVHFEMVTYHFLNHRR